MSDEQEATPAPETHFARLGGTRGVQAIVSDFVDRVVSDLMIGFFFKKVPLDRLKQRELEFAINHLGGSVLYTGRPLQTAHAPHRIMGGQFNRRLVILKQTLHDHKVPPDIISDWLAHNESLRAAITVDGPFACNGELPAPAVQK